MHDFENEQIADIIERYMNYETITSIAIMYRTSTPLIFKLILAKYYGHEDENQVLQSKINEKDTNRQREAIAAENDGPVQGSMCIPSETSQEDERISRLSGPGCD